MSQHTSKDEVLAQVKAAFGVVPNLMAGIAGQNPAVAAAYLAASGALEGGVLSAVEKQIVDAPFKAQAKRSIRLTA